eukprot:jgi/Galph1/914/GphlegSOOS_G5726.1
MQWSFLVSRVAHWFANQVIVKGLANSEAFQRFAVRSSQAIEELVRKGETKFVQATSKRGVSKISPDVFIQQLAEKLADARVKTAHFSEALKEEVKKSFKNR